MDVSKLESCQVSWSPGVDPDPLPESRVERPVPHAKPRFERELLTFADLGCVHVLVEFRQGQHPECHVAGFVTPDAAN